MTLYKGQCPTKQVNKMTATSIVKTLVMSHNIPDVILEEICVMDTRQENGLIEFMINLSHPDADAQEVISFDANGNWEISL